MKDRDLILLLIVLGGAWYLYTRSQGLTLAGGYENPMLAPGTGLTNKQSLVRPSSSTSTQALNPFSAVLSAVQGILRTVAQPGNTSSRPAASSGTYSDGNPTSNWGVPNIGDPMPAYDPSLQEANPYWMWDMSFERPAQTTVPQLDWTLTGPVDYNYIPPPPGS